MTPPGVLDVYRYRLPLVHAVSLSSGELSFREGLIVRVRREDGTVGLGDVAPLLGFSRETLADAERWFSAGGIDDAPASIRFALDTAREPWHPCQVSINALLPRGTQDLVGQARALRDAGYKAVKLKVGGSGSLDSDIADVHAVASVLGETCSLRLDANRAWDCETALSFDAAVKGLNIEYIEEPVREPRQLPEFIEHAALPLALDESVSDPNLFASLLATGRVRAAVLKPTLLGAVDDIRLAVERTVAVGATPVFSACFESGVGIGAVARLAARWGGDTPCGLDTYRVLARDVLKAPLQLGDGALRVDQEPELDLDVLEVVPCG